MNRRAQATSSTAHPYLGFRARVISVGSVTPNLLRVTLGGDQLAGAVSAGYDQRVKLLFPLNGDDSALPTGPSWYEDYRALPDDVRPVMRTYTVRRHRPEVAEFDIEFALHGASGPASAWAQRAQPGDVVGVAAPNALHRPIIGWEFDPNAGADWILLAGDETAVPAIGSIVERLPSGTQVKAFVAIAHSRDTQRFETAAAVDITWLPRGEPESGLAGLLTSAVREADLPSGRPYAWVAGERTPVRQLKSHLLQERGFDKKSLYACAYWHLGRTEDAS
jgi:NADPH-dependent ferric siderophore reductase